MNYPRRFFGFLLASMIILLICSAMADISTNLKMETVFNSNNRKLVDSKSYVDDNGNLVIASDKGYSTIRYSYTTNSRISKIELLDERGNPINGTEGWSIRTTKYSIKGVAEQCYYNAKGVPVTGPEGYARIVTKYENKRHISTWQYDPEGNPIGWHRISKYGKHGRYTLMESDTWYDPDGNLTAGPNGYARVEYGYSVITKNRTAYIGADGNPYYYEKAKYATQESKYKEGKIMETRNYGADGELCAGPNGYAYVIYSYRGKDASRLAMYYNADGSLYFNKKGICGIRIRRGIKNRIIDEQYYVGEDIRGLSTDGYSRIKTNYNSKGKITAQWYYDENDHLKVVESLGYAGVQYEYRNAKYLSKTSYFDENAKLMNGPEGAAVIQHIYGKDNAVKTTNYLGADGKTLVNNPDGYARIEYIRDKKKNILTEKYYDANGNSFIGKQHADELRYTWSGNTKESESYWAGGEPVLCEQGYHNVTFEYTSSGRVSKESYFDIDNNSTLCKDGYASKEYEYNSKGKIMATRYYDITGNLTLTPGKEYAYQRTVLFSDRDFFEGEYESEEVEREDLPENEAEQDEASEDAEEETTGGTIQEYYGTDGKLMNLAAGYAYVIKETNANGEAIRLSYFDREGKAALINQGISVINRRYDEKGNIISEWYLDKEGEPAAHKKNKYHRIERTYQDSKHITSEEWFDTDGSPMTIDDTYVRIEKDFDEKGNTIAERTYGADGNPIARKAGYDEVRREFGENNKAVSISYYLKGAPTLTTAGVSVVKRQYDEKGNITSEWYLGVDGEPIRHLKNKYHRVDRIYLDAKHITSEAWFDTDGSPMALDDTYARIEKDFDEKWNTIAERTYGADGNLIARKAGYDEVRRIFGDNNKALTIAYYLNGDPVLTKDKISIIQRQYDENGNIASERYFGVNGEPVVHKKNKYHRIDREYLDAKHITSEAWYGKDGLPMKMNNNKYCALRREFDEKKNIRTIRYYGGDGGPVACKAGYEMIRFKYNDKNKKIFEEYLDHDGNPMANNKGVYQKIFEYDEKGRVVHEQYCDASGDPAPDTDGHAGKTIVYRENGKVSEEIFE